jgi:hypothetical protein
MKTLVAIALVLSVTGCDKIRKITGEGKTEPQASSKPTASAEPSAKVVKKGTDKASASCLKVKQKTKHEESPEFEVTNTCDQTVGSFSVWTYAYDDKDKPLGRVKKEWKGKLEPDGKERTELGTFKDAKNAKTFEPVVVAVAFKEGDTWTDESLAPERRGIGGSPLPAATEDDVVDFTGKYDSTEGFATITQQGEKVTINYGKGVASCKAKKNKLWCGWNEGGSSYGQAQFTKNPNGGMTGTWGHENSAYDGGGWSFTPRR